MQAVQAERGMLLRPPPSLRLGRRRSRPPSQTGAIRMTSSTSTTSHLSSGLPLAGSGSAGGTAAPGGDELLRRLWSYTGPTAQIRNLSRLALSQGFTLWHYRGHEATAVGDDRVEPISVATALDWRFWSCGRGAALLDLMRDGDVVIVSCANGSLQGAMRIHCDNLDLPALVAAGVGLDDVHPPPVRGVLWVTAQTTGVDPLPWLASLRHRPAA
jgi:hypothetical protein